MAGEIESAKSWLRKFALHTGICVTVEPTTFIYTGGAEEGFVVGLVNYPRFPSSAEELWSKATAIAEGLVKECGQHSYLIVGPDHTTWVSNREDKG